MHQYAAGLIDGEGYIGIQETGGSFQVRLKVAMSDKGRPAVDHMSRLYGGNIYETTRKDPRQRDTCTWTLTGEKAATVIREIKPWLIVKREPAEIALSFQMMLESANRRPNGRREWTDEMRAKAAELKARIHYANRTGRDPEPTAHPDSTPLAKYRLGHWWDATDSLFGPEPFTGGLPASGMMVEGVIYETPAPEQACPPVGPLLMTPVAAEGVKPSNTMGVARRSATGQVFLTNQIVSLMGLDPSEAGALTPPPSTDGKPYSDVPLPIPPS